MSPEIRVRACLAVVQDGRILLVPHYDTDAGAVQWNLPGGRVAFGESVRRAALREFEEETGLQAEITGLLDVTEVIVRERPWHSITITFLARVAGGELAAEPGHSYGEKLPRWLAASDIEASNVHPARAVAAALGIQQSEGHEPSPARGRIEQTTQSHQWR